MSQAPRHLYVAPVASCGCGRSYSKAQWPSLPLVGTQHTPAGPDPIAEPAIDSVLRNCVCGSTISADAEQVDNESARQVGGTAPALADSASNEPWPLADRLARDSASAERAIQRANAAIESIDRFLSGEERQRAHEQRVRDFGLGLFVAMTGGAR